MPLFREGQRVRIPVNNQTAPSVMYGKEGVITFVGPPSFFIKEGSPEEPMETAYSVRFDGDGEDRDMFEGQLEAL